MPFGLFISLLCHAVLIGWAYWSMHRVPEFKLDDTPAISVEVLTPSEFLHLKQGAEDSKNLETKAKEDPKQDDSKNNEKKPEAAAPAPPPPPPPPQEVAKAEPPPPPEPPKAAEPEPKKAEPPPPPPPAPGPTPDEQKLLEQKIEDDRQKAEDEAKRKAAEEEAKKKAQEEEKKRLEAEAKKKAEELKKKKLEDEKKKKLAEAKKKADEAKKKFDPNAIANLLEKSPDDAKTKALLDKDPRKKGQQAAGTSQTATATGREAGVANGHDAVLSAREADLLKGKIKSQLEPCSKMPGGGGGIDTPIVELEWSVNPDGTLQGEPVVIAPQGSPLFQIAAQASINAVRNCPLSLPPDKYDAWKRLRWTFNWPKILGLQQ